MGAFTKQKDTIQRESNLIFVVTGTQEPFDRMISIIDQWSQNQVKYNVIAQTANSVLKVKSIKCYDFLEPDVFTELFTKAEIIISHAGMGSIIKALENKKKIIIFPRLAKFKEHRNNHQVFTAKNFEKSKNINVAYDEKDLLSLLSNIDSLTFKETNSLKASENLINSISEFIRNS